MEGLKTNAPRLRHSLPLHLRDGRLRRAVGGERRAVGRGGGGVVVLRVPARVRIVPIGDWGSGFRVEGLELRDSGSGVGCRV